MPEKSTRYTEYDFILKISLITFRYMCVKTQEEFGRIIITVNNLL